MNKGSTLAHTIRLQNETEIIFPVNYSGSNFFVCRRGQLQLLSAAVPSTGFGIFNGDAGTSMGTSFNYFINGTATSGGGNLGIAEASSNTNAFGIHGDNSSHPFNGQLAEILVTGGSVSTATRQQVEGYLAHKWGLTANLPAGHPYKTTPP